MKPDLINPDVINKDRLARSFLELVQIDSVSKEEGAVCRHLTAGLNALGVDTVVDDAGTVVGGESGNLIGHYAGNRKVPPLLLSAHMDTVEPGRGIRPVFENGIFRSSGNTILGADDKCGVAIILEALHCIAQGNLPCGPLEVVFTICEEIGLQGAKHLAYDRLASQQGYVLDTRNPDAMVTRAPGANRLRIEITGKAAHAGAEPEKGINAIVLAAEAIAQLTLGRIDHETTCNIGMVQGGMATNIVPDRVVLHGEVRSHDRSKLDEVTDTIVGTFKRVVDGADANVLGSRPQLRVDVELDFDRLAIGENAVVVQTAIQAASNLNRKIHLASSGGGSDANILAQHGIVAGVLGTGCQKVHTVEERVALDDMVRATELLLEIVRIHAEA